MKALIPGYRAAAGLLALGLLLQISMTQVSMAQDSLRLGPGRASKKVTTKSDVKSPVVASEKKPKVETAVAGQAIKPIELPAAYNGSRAEAWDALFAAQRKKSKDAAFSAGVRAKIRRLVKQEDFAQTREIISAALNHDAVESWMYEALALSLEATGGSEKEIERTVLSAVDLARDPDAALAAADYLVSLKLDRAAIRLFQEIATQDPNRTEPYLQALRCAQRAKDAEAIRWCCVGILRQAWPSDQREVEVHARRVAEATIMELERAGKTAEAKAFQSELAAATARDVRIRVWWTGDADIDLAVLEPTGEICSYRNPRSTGGGQILGDSFSRSNRDAPSDGFSETFICPEGFSGNYQVQLKKVWGEVAGGKVNVEIITHLGGADEKLMTRQQPLGADGALLTFDLPSGRRTEALPQARASRAATQQIEVARHVLAQQLGSGSGSASTSDYYASNAPFVFNPLGQLGFPAFQGAVGFRPQITTLQDGPVLFAGPAVVSADRRFVRVTLRPQFRTIGDVQTFNFATGAVGNGNGSGNTQTNNGTGGAGNSGGTNGSGTVGS